MSEFDIISDHTRVVESAIGRAINEGWVTDRQLAEFSAMNPKLREEDLLTDVDIAIFPHLRTAIIKNSMLSIANNIMAPLGLDQNIIKQP